MTWRIPDEMHIGADLAGKVLDALQQDDDPLLIAQWDDHGEADRIEHAVGTALRGANPAETRRLVRSLERRRLKSIRGIDDLTANLMAHAGVDPLVMAWLAEIDGSYAQLQGAKPYATLDQQSTHEDGHNVTGVRIGASVTWYACGTLVLDGMPQTILAAAPGRPLRAIASHPLLDDRPFTIQDVDEDGLVQVSGGWDGVNTATPSSLAVIAMPGRR